MTRGAESVCIPTPRNNSSSNWSFISLLADNLFNVDIGSGFEVVGDDDLYIRLKNLLYPKSGNHRRPAHPGPCEKLELFIEAMTLVTQFKVFLSTT